MKVEDILFENVAQTNEKVLEELKEKLNSVDQSGEWVLCLGAGVSISVGLPSWYKLLAKITAQMFPLKSKFVGAPSSSQAYYKDIKKFYEELKKDDVFVDKLSEAFEGEYEEVFRNINVLEAAEYVRDFLDSEIRETKNTGQDELLEERIDWNMNYLIQQACRFDEKIDKSNSKITQTTLAAVAGLMKTEEDSLIHDVITYNYDNLLETYLRNMCDCDPDKVHSITKIDQLQEIGNKDEWNIYHVHGRIPVQNYKGEEMSGSVILTESDYYEEERINYSWTNIMQSYAIARTNLIFIGFSGSDYNFRRIIKYVNQDKGIVHKRYIFFSVDDIVKAVLSKEIKKGCTLEQCLEKLEKNSDEYAFEKFFINHLVYAQTVYWGNHGLDVIWTSHEQIVAHLNSLHV